MEWGRRGGGDLDIRMAQQYCCVMARRVRANKSLIRQRYHVAKLAFPDDADLARSLGVHRSAVVRWKRGEAPAPKNWEQLVGLDTVDRKSTRLNSSHSSISY